MVVVAVRRGVRVGLAALVVGWSLTGGAGVGFADTGSVSAATSPGSSRDSAGTSASRTAAAGAPGSHRARPVAASATGKTAAAALSTAASRAAAGVDMPTVAMTIAAGRADGAPRRQGRITGDTSRDANSTQRARAAVAIPGRPAPEPTPAVGVVAAALAHPAVEGSPAATAAPTATAQRTTTPTREISPSPALATAAARITAAIDKVLDRLSTLPTSPINEVLSGALLLVRRALQPTGSPSPFGVGATKLTVRNETKQSFELWAYYDGSTDNAKVKVATLQPGQEWSNTAYNALSFDHNLEIVVDGVPKARMTATNNWAQYGDQKPRMWFYAPTTGYTGQQATEYAPHEDPPADWDVANLLGLAEGLKTGQSEWISFPNYPDRGVTDLNVWVWRGPDIDSGKWWVANTKQFVVAVKQIPGPSQVYNHSYDPIWDRNTAGWLPYDEVTWYYFDPNAAPA